MDWNLAGQVVNDLINVITITTNPTMPPATIKPFLTFLLLVLFLISWSNRKRSSSTNAIRGLTG
jgi:hypothetical protein